MIEYKIGNLIDAAKNGEVSYIAHCCNCFCTMGSGIAPQIKYDFPYACEADLATTKGDYKKLGTIDKDFLVEGDKVYSPSTCLFLPSELNKFITTNAASRGIYPLGVYYMKKPKHMVNEHSKPYVSQINNQAGRNIYLGIYSTPEEAHQVYLNAKLRYCEEYLEEFKDEPLIVKGLIRIKNKVQHHINNNLLLTRF